MKNGYRLMWPVVVTAVCLVASLGVIRTALAQTEVKLTASDAAAFDRFGNSVSIDGDRVVVGARDDDDAGTRSGSAYIFHFDGTSWSQETKLTASDAAAGDQFGESVSIDGDRVVVGAWQDDDGGSASGSVYVYDLGLLLLLNQIENLIAEGTLNNGQGNALISKVEGAIAMIENGNLNAAVNKLQAFINQVEDFIDTGILTTAEGETLIEAAQAIIDQISGSARIAHAAPALQHVLLQMYPNPFNPTTTIRFSVPEASVVMLAVYDVLGREVRVLVDGVREAGTHEVVFEASGLPSGTYLVRLETPQGSFVKTMQLVK